MQGTVRGAAEKPQEGGRTRGPSKALPPAPRGEGVAQGCRAQHRLGSPGRSGGLEPGGARVGSEDILKRGLMGIAAMWEVRGTEMARETPA